MASNSLGAEQQRHVKLLRRQRGLLVSQLPQLDVLLKYPKLKQHLNGYEQSQVLTQRVHSEQAEKFLDIMGFKSYNVYQDFLEALRPLKPSLVVRLEGAEREVSGGSTASSPASNESSPKHLANGYSNEVEDVQNNGQQRNLVAPVQEAEGQRQRVVEDAGIFGLSGCGSGPVYHLSHLSYSGREFLASRLNGKPPERIVFHDFCHALGVDNKLVQASVRSRNPTGYLIQTYSARPEATFERLEQALTQIGRNDLYQELFDMMENGDFDDDDEM